MTRDTRIRTAGVGAVLAVVGVGLTACGTATDVSGRAGQTPASSAAPTSASTSAPQPAASPSAYDEVQEIRRDALPALFPAVDLPLAGPGETLSDPIEPEQRLGIELTSGSASDGEVEDGQARLVVSGYGKTRSAPLPAGWMPSVVGKRFDFGQAGSAWLVRQEGGDSDTWSLFSDFPDSLVPVTVSDGAPFGSGYSEDGARRHTTWVTRPGRIFTRVALGDDRFEVYEWELDGPGEGALPPGTVSKPWVPTLTPTDLGVVCIDESVTPTAYGRC